MDEMTYEFDGVRVRVSGGRITQQEAAAYLDHAVKSNPTKSIESLEVRVCEGGEEVELAMSWQAVPFERIRRITGYLVGDMDRWNDAKTKEEADRVKHAI